MRHGRRLAAVLVVLALGTGIAVSGEASGARSCSSYPTPGNVTKARTPADLGAEYAVLRRPKRPRDQLRRSQLGASLSASDVVLRGARLLATPRRGLRIYLVPAEHLLAFKLAPARCLPRSQRSLERFLRPSLLREYAHHALCVLVLHRTQISPSCYPAPGTVAPLLFAPRVPGFGMVPNGVAAVVVHDLNGDSHRVVVHGNFWIFTRSHSPVAPCGLDWLDRVGIVLRSVRSCTGDTT